MTMNFRTTILRSLGFCLLLAVLGMGLTARASAEAVKLEAILIWGTNDATSPDPNHKPVSDAMAKKLACFKYSNYFEVNRKQFTLAADGKGKARLSKDCEVSVKKLERNEFEVTLIGKGQPTATIKKEIKKGSSLVTGGNAANSTAWFVVVRQVD
jgi:hypothetical protein